VRAVAIAAVALGVFSVTNFAYHVVRKPTEMFFPVSGALNKMPAETWRQYAPLFNEYSTATITPELLAALAQVESAGNPVARTYWRWRLTWHPFEIYRPASSAVGMYQLTDAAFADARHYCIRHSLRRALGTIGTPAGTTDSTPVSYRATPSSLRRCPWTGTSWRYSHVGQARQRVCSRRRISLPSFISAVLVRPQPSPAVVFN
jgi:hypothetical protein